MRQECFVRCCLKERGGITMEHKSIIEEELHSILKENMDNEEALYEVAELFKVFGDTTRIRIIFLLFQHEECVCDIARKLNMTQSAISHQLRILKQARLVSARREGKTIFYALADHQIGTIFRQAMEHISE